MKLYTGILVLVFAIAISAVAAYFSIVGLAALFSAAFLAVLIMGIVLEGSKLVTAGWLHANWSNPNVSRLHRLYLVIAVITLMAITSIGIFGFLSAAHLEQKAPAAGLQIEIDQYEDRVLQLTTQRDQLLQQQEQINKTVTSYLEGGQARGASQFMRQQRSERAALGAQIDAVNQEIMDLNSKLAPLKRDVAGVEAKLGPLKYIAETLGWDDPSSAVKIIILMLMLAFDPLAVILLISATITLGEWSRERRNDKPVDKIDHEKTMALDNVPGEVIIPTIASHDEIATVETEIPENNHVEEVVVQESGPPTLEEKTEPSVAENLDDDVMREIRTTYVAPFWDEQFRRGNTEMVNSPKVVLPSMTNEEKYFELSDKDRILDMLEKNPEVLNEIVTLVHEDIEKKRSSETEQMSGWLTEENFAKGDNPQS